MTDTVLFASRILKLPLLGPDGETIGRVHDLVLGPPVGGAAPPLLGLVASVNRRSIFVAAARVAGIAPSGVRLRTQAVDLRPFQPRRTELLASSLFDRSHGDEQVVDVGLAATARLAGAWEASVVALGRPGHLRRARPARVVDWTEVAGLFETGEVGRDVAALRGLHPSDMARAVTRLTPARRGELAAALPDEDLADVLQELPEASRPESSRSWPPHGPPGCWRRWSPTTPPTCWPSCPARSAAACSRRCLPRKLTLCGGS